MTEDSADLERKFVRVHEAELRRICARRETLKLERKGVAVAWAYAKALDALDGCAPPAGAKPKRIGDLVGLALSGGGVRSATFNLGFLQGLLRYDLLRFVDYLSTVSGGGYIGSCLTSILHDEGTSVRATKMPLRLRREAEARETDHVLHVRRHARYIAQNPRLTRIDYWRMTGMYVTGLVINNLFPLGVLCLVVTAAHVVGAARLAVAAWVSVGAAVSALLGALVLRYVGAKGAASTESRHRIGYGVGVLTFTAAASLVGWAVVWVIGHPADVESGLAATVEVVFGGSVAVALTRLKQWNTPWMRKTVAAVAPSALCVALPAGYLLVIVLLAPHVPVSWAFALGVGLVVVSLFLDANWTSLHFFYRDRLAEAYVIGTRKDGEARKDDGTRKSEPEIVTRDLPLRDLYGACHNVASPYHILNATLNVPTSEAPDLAERGADFFIFSREYCGSKSTGWARTANYADGVVDLASAMAVSGAAVSPRMGTASTLGYGMVLTLLNLRLNRWFPNPMRPGRCRSIAPYYFVKEILGLGTEKDRMLNLSDGGHHENLGLYELLRRRCRYIIVCDAGADSESGFQDFANLQRKARIDMAIHIDINLAGLRPNGDRETPLHFATGRIQYPFAKESGILIYVKTSVTGREPEDLLAYRRTQETFPDQSTADQFFDEAQFESYRWLGHVSLQEIVYLAVKSRLVNTAPVSMTKEEKWGDKDASALFCRLDSFYNDLYPRISDGKASIAGVSG